MGQQEKHQNSTETELTYYTMSLQRSGWLLGFPCFCAHDPPSDLNISDVDRSWRKSTQEMEWMNIECLPKFQ